MNDSTFNDCYVVSFLKAILSAEPEHVYYSPDNNTFALTVGFKSPKITWGKNTYFYIGEF